MQMPRRRGGTGEAAGRWSMRLAAVAVLSASALLPAPASALNFEEWVQGLTVTPFFSERVEYQSNVFQTPNHERGDTIFKTIPGFLAELSRGPFAASVGYRAEILNYVALSDQNTVNHFGVVQLKYDLPRLKLQLKNDFVETTDPPGSELTGPIKSQTNVLAPTAEYRLTERFSLGVNYAWTHINYPGNAPAGTPNEQQNQAVQQLNEDQHMGGATVWEVLAQGGRGPDGPVRLADLPQRPEPEHPHDDRGPGSARRSHVEALVHVPNRRGTPGSDQCRAELH